MTAAGLATIGLDVGGTKAAAVLVDPITGTVLDRERASSAGSAENLVTTLTDLVETLRARSTGLHVEVGAVGLGIAGLVDRDGMVRWSPNLPAAVGHPVAADLAGGSGLPVAATNDATAATLAESRLGAGRAVTTSLWSPWAPVSAPGSWSTDDYCGVPTGSPVSRATWWSIRAAPSI